jgi:di/tricarboxylate transporter
MLDAQALAIGITLLVLVLAASNRVPADLAFLLGMVLVMLTGLLPVGEAVAGFANTGMLTIAVLYVVVAGLRETGAMAWVSIRFLGSPRGTASAQMRLMLPTGLLSAFINNTPVVAIFVPVVQGWATRFRIPASKLMMPLSFIAILTGTCTLIGTSTNLVVDGLMQRDLGHPGLGMFDITPLGLCVAFAGLIYIVLATPWLLPDRQGAVEQFEDAREYAFELRVTPGGPLVGKSIADAGLRNLTGAYLAEVQRGSHIIPAVGSDEVLQGGDVLVCIGVVDAVAELRRIPGLEVAERQAGKLDLHHAQRRLVELVISPSSPVVGKTVKEAEFRSRYRAAILSISRAGERLGGRVGDIELQGGDTLLVEAARDFARRHRYNRDFLLVSELDDSTPPDFSRAPIALGILVAMIAVSTFEWVSLLEAAFLAGGAMVATRCLTMDAARRSIEYPVLIVIAASFALGESLERSGAARDMAEWMVGFANHDPLLTLITVYIATVLFTEVITNNAAAVLMFPIAVASAVSLGVDPLPFLVAIMFAASASFLTPIGYQTNLMVYGPGGYRFGDYFRFGIPLTLIVGVVTLALIPILWKF